MLGVIARYTAKPGKGDDVAAALRDHIRATRTEPGCLQFLVNRSVDDPDQFVLCERFESREALDEHAASPHYQRYVKDTIMPLLENRTVEFYEPVEP